MKYCLLFFYAAPNNILTEKLLLLYYLCNIIIVILEKRCKPESYNKNANIVKLLTDIIGFFSHYRNIMSRKITITGLNVFVLFKKTKKIITGKAENIVNFHCFVHNSENINIRRCIYIL